MQNKTEPQQTWAPAYKAKLENLVEDMAVVKALTLTDACRLMYEQKTVYRHHRTLEEPGEKSFGLYLFKKV